ncbi:hypothetical protein DFS34DRAFT_57429 [Phlyctochytrium arcticum]|nr:hypothetical protein DFS34DRAFT_57429 [Phlyctochytrium arcticum]
MPPAAGEGIPPTVRQLLSQHNIKVSDTWAQDCITHLRADTPGLSDSQLSERFFQQYLHTDLVEHQQPVLPPDTIRAHKIVIGSPRGIVLQVEDILEIGSSVNSMLEKILEYKPKRGEPPRPPHDCLKLPRKTLSISLSDGVNELKAIEVTPLAGIAVDDLLGMKVVVSNTTIRRGVAFLEGRNWKVLGGYVPELNSDDPVVRLEKRFRHILGIPQVSTPEPPRAQATNSSNIAQPNLASNQLSAPTNISPYFSHSTPTTSLAPPITPLSRSTNGNTEENLEEDFNDDDLQALLDAEKSLNDDFDDFDDDDLEAMFKVEEAYMESGSQADHVVDNESNRNPRGAESVSDSAHIPSLTKSEGSSALAWMRQLSSSTSTVKRYETAGTEGLLMQTTSSSISHHAQSANFAPSTSRIDRPPAVLDPPLIRSTPALSKPFVSPLRRDNSNSNNSAPNIPSPLSESSHTIHNRTNNNANAQYKGSPTAKADGRKSPLDTPSPKKQRTSIPLILTQLRELPQIVMAQSRTRVFVKARVLAWDTLRLRKEIGYLLPVTISDETDTIRVRLSNQIVENFFRAPAGETRRIRREKGPEIVAETVAKFTAYLGGLDCFMVLDLTPSESTLPDMELPVVIEFKERVDDDNDDVIIVE